MSSHDTTIDIAPSSKHNSLADFLKEQESKTLLRFITCGSVDDGKSTLIGRLLFETNAIAEDELQTLQQDSKKYGTTGEALDYALLVDGLSSEREQGITIDVAYRFFSTIKRKFIVADTPGHEQYTRNMATGGSTADLAIVMVDASKGLTTQTKRHSFITSQLGINHLVLAVNKMDLIDYDQEKFSAIEIAYRKWAKQLNINELSIIPISALSGDNICTHSVKTKWYYGPTLLQLLEQVEPSKQQQQDFRLSVQWVNRPNQTFRGYAGTINSGQVRPGDKLCIQPSNQFAHVDKIISYKKDLAFAGPGQAITLTFKEQVDISRGTVLSAEKSPCEVSEKFQVTLLWVAEKPLITGRQYVLKCATQTSLCTAKKPKYQIDVNTMEKRATNTLASNEVGVCELYLNKPIAFESYRKNKALGGFILIDRLSNETVACGWLDFALRRANNIHKHYCLVDQKARSQIKGHKPCVLWFTGISGAGKSTIANELEKMLNELKVHTMLLDGDNVRHGLNKDIGFSEHDRAENIRRIAEVAKLMNESGLISLVSFISPYSQEREMAAELIGKEHFIEIFIDTELSIAESRDVKGLYKKARRGEIKNFTGIDSPYQKPSKPEIHIHTATLSANEAALSILATLKEKGILL